MTRAWPACQMRPRLSRDGNQTRPKQTNKTHTDRDTELLSARVSHGLNQKKKESLSRSDRLTHTRNPVLSCCKGSRSRRGQENHGPSPANLTRCRRQATCIWRRYGTIPTVYGCAVIRMDPRRYRGTGPPLRKPGAARAALPNPNIKAGLESLGRPLPPSTSRSF